MRWADDPNVTGLARLGRKPDVECATGVCGRTRTIGAIVPGLASDFCVELLSAIQKTLTREGWSLIILPVKQVADDARLWDHQLRGRVEGALLVGLPPASMRNLARRDIPAVIVDAEAPCASSVVFDHTVGTAAAIAHLVDLGHRRIAFIDGPETGLQRNGCSARLRGYSAALTEANLMRRTDHERVAGSCPQTAAVLNEWLRLSDPPTAVLASDDRLALALLDAMRLAGQRVPEDLAVVGYGDTTAARYVGLTTIRLPMRAMANEAVGLLLRAIDQPEAPPVQVRLSPELIVRGSSRSPGHRDAA